jgi:hypothetical protein
MRPDQNSIGSPCLPKRPKVAVAGKTQNWPLVPKFSCQMAMVGGCSHSGGQAAPPILLLHSHHPRLRPIQSNDNPFPCQRQSIPFALHNAASASLSFLIAAAATPTEARCNAIPTQIARANRLAARQRNPLCLRHNRSRCTSHYHTFIMFPPSTHPVLAGSVIIVLNIVSLFLSWASFEFGAQPLPPSFLIPNAFDSMHLC